MDEEKMFGEKVEKVMPKLINKKCDPFQDVKLSVDWRIANSGASVDGGIGNFVGAFG
jgi:hypothetical protein